MFIVSKLFCIYLAADCYNILRVVQREITCRSEALGVKLMSEEKVMLLQEELEAVKRELTRCQAECSNTKKLLSRKVHRVSFTLDCCPDIDC